MGQVIVMTSGKGGTGKTSLTAGIAAGMALAGHKVLCIDGDIGLRNLDIALGMTDCALMDFTDVVLQECPLALAAAVHPEIETLSLLTAPLTMPEDFPGEDGMKAVLAQAREQYDYIFVDSPATLGEWARLSLCDADRVLLAVTMDPNALRDAQRVVSGLSHVEQVHLITNRVIPRMLNRLGMTIDDAMDTVGLPLIGIVPDDAAVQIAASQGTALALRKESRAAKACANIAARLDGKSVPLMKFRFWE